MHCCRNIFHNPHTHSGPHTHLTHTYTHTHTHLHIHLHTHTCTHTPAHTHLRTHTHTHTHMLSVRPTELVAAVQEARAAGNDAKAARVLAGALKQLRLSRLKPDPALNVALTTLGKEDSELFNNPPAIEVPAARHSIYPIACMLSVC